MEWAQIFLQRQLPLSFAELPTFLHVVSTVGKVQSRGGKEKEVLKVNKNNYFKHIYPLLSLSPLVACSQLTTKERWSGH